VGKDNFKREEIGSYFSEQLQCRICFSTKLETFLDLGVTELADRFSLTSESNITNLRFPLAVNICKTCGWIQLSITVDKHLIYRNDYPYDSRTTETGQKHWASLAIKAVQLFSDSKSQLRVLDIGSNTGALLSEFKRLKMQVLGIDPSVEAAKIAERHGINNFVGFFGKEAINYIKNLGFRPDIVVSTNSFAHIDNLYEWLSGVSEIISESGFLIIECPHVLELIRLNQFDTIYHEHLSYVSLSPLKKLFSGFNFKIFKVEKLPIHGGSIRIYATKQNIEAHGSVNDMIIEENEAGIRNFQTLKNFAKNVECVKRDIRQLLNELCESSKSVGIVSAPAKGMTFFTYCGLRDFEYLGISDKNSLKIGKYAPGTEMIVMSDKELVSKKPDYLLILAWNFKVEIMTNLQKLGFSKKFIIGIPKVEVIDA
jgi:SAM-dependent methyltransferase